MQKINDIRLLRVLLRCFLLHFNKSINTCVCVCANHRKVISNLLTKCIAKSPNYLSTNSQERKICTVFSYQSINQDEKATMQFNKSTTTKKARKCCAQLNNNNILNKLLPIPEKQNTKKNFPAHTSAAATGVSRVLYTFSV